MLKILFTILIIYFIILIFNNNKTSNCIISLDKYPELKLLENNKKLILNDLKSVINKKWIDYNSIHKDELDYFSQVDEVSVFKKFKSLEKNLNDNIKNPSWKTMVLIFNEKLTKYSKNLTNTVNLLKKIPGIKHAGFSCFEPGAVSNYHTDNNLDTYRYHLPLIIPKGDCKFKIYDKNFHFEKPLIFNDSCKHQVWNRTLKNRIIMIIDIYRK